ncbi:cytochrome b [Gallaecimonas mangrovi]|uniref:cytochrome b n=1 Tax=Gallaecimonas mangrovi TaxID=2291597 RepID=UPI000E20A0F7|nr:cytochrome b/b6 domain-containing protein [Gallaecimonas mangrovi]
MLKNTSWRYGLLAHLFHWLMALLILALFAVGLSMGLPEKGSGLRALLKNGHISLGVLTLLLLVGRGVWRCVNPLPKQGLSPLNAKLAHWGHLLLYLLMAAVLLAGLGVVLTRPSATPLWWGFSLPGFGGAIHHRLEHLHRFFAWALVLTVAGHVAMSIVHRLKGDKLQRGMLRRSGHD